MALAAMRRLMRRCGLHPEEVGQLRVGSASVLDRSKSMKSELMALLEASGCASAAQLPRRGAFSPRIEALPHPPLPRVDPLHAAPPGPAGGADGEPGQPG